MTLKAGRERHELKVAKVENNGIAAPSSIISQTWRTKKFQNKLRHVGNQIFHKKYFQAKFHETNYHRLTKS